MLDKIISYIILFFVSSLILAYEILFIRIFSLVQWQGYVSLIISLALSGFGISGTILIFLKKFIKNSLSFSFLLVIFHFVISLVCLFIFCIVPFNPFQIGWSKKEFIYLFLQFFTLIPFFTLGALIVGIQFISNFKVSEVYFINLIGSSIGAFLPVVLLHFFSPYQSLMLLFFLYGILIIIIGVIKYRTFNCLFLICLPILLHFLITNFNLLKISEYKGLQYALKLPEAKIITEKNTPLSTIHVIKAKGLREVKGLSYSFTGEIPEQICIYFDGDNASPINPFNEEIKKLEFLSYTTQALPYYLLEDSIDKVLIVGTGGGEGILRALYFNAKEIKGIELNKGVIDLMKNELSEFSGNIYNLENVDVKNCDASDYIKNTKEFFDIIEIALLDSFIGSGLNSIGENYIYTVESLFEFYSKLTNRGIIAITRWLKEPAYDSIKIFSLAIEMAKTYRIEDFLNKIVFIRSANTSTLCISKNKINIDKVKKFLEKMCFEPIFFYGIDKNDIEKFYKSKNSDLFETCIKLVQEGNYVKDYIFDIRPTTDDRPYYYNFIKLKTIKLIWEKGAKFIPFNEWGFLLLVILFSFVSIFCFAFIILPLFFSKKLKLSEIKKNNIVVFLYFFIIAISYFFIEVVLIQKFSLFIMHPVYSITIVIVTMLFFSGLGSLFFEKFKNKIIIFSFIIFILLIYLFFINKIFNFLFHYNFIIRIMLSIILIGIPSFFMGMPYPSLFSIIKEKRPILACWAYGINGFASVISILSANILSIIYGFKLVLLFSILLYFLAFILYLLFNKKIT